MTPEQRAAALRLAEELQDAWLANKADGSLLETYRFLRALAAEPELKAPLSMHGKQAEPVAWLTRDAQDGLWHATAQRKSSEDRPLYLRPPQDTALREENERLRGIVPEVLEKLNDDLCDENAKLREAAQAVVERWDTPNWKDAEPTAAVIERLRGVLEAK